MIGYAAEERCPYCRMILGVVATEPGCRVLHSISCRSGSCRGRRIVFEVLDGHATELTNPDKADMVIMQRGQAAKSLAS